MLVNVPVAVPLTAAITVIVALAPEASDAIVAVTVFAALVTVPPPVAVPEVNVRPAGSGSVTTTLVAVEGPLFVTVMV